MTPPPKTTYYVHQLNSRGRKLSKSNISCSTPLTTSLLVGDPTTWAQINIIYYWTLYNIIYGTSYIVYIYICVCIYVCIYVCVCVCDIKRIARRRVCLQSEDIGLLLILYTRRRRRDSARRLRAARLFGFV